MAKKLPTEFSRLTVTNLNNPDEGPVILTFTDFDLCFAVFWELRARGYDVARSDHYSINCTVESAIEHCAVFLDKRIAT